MFKKNIMNGLILCDSFKKDVVVGWPKILMSAPVPLELIWLGLTRLGLGLGGLGFGTGLDNIILDVN